MKRIIFILLVCTTILSSKVNAAPDLIFDINGTILAGTCTISSLSKNMQVDLGSHTVMDINSVNYPSKNFSIILENCGTSVLGVNMYFSGPTYYLDPSMLQSQEMVSKNICVQTKNPVTNLPINFDLSSLYKRLEPGKNNEIIFNSRIIKCNPAKPILPGQIAVTMNYTLEYL